MYACCIPRKEVHQSCPLYLISYFQPPILKLEKQKEDLMNLCCRVLGILALRTQGDIVRNTLQDPVSADADPASEITGPATSVAS